VSEWIKFHAELCDGEKRGIPRSARFIFLELSLLARKRQGEVVCVKAPTLVKAVCDLIRGDMAEVKRAIPVLMHHQMIEAEETESSWIVRIPSWARWNSFDKSTDRVSAMRTRRRENQAEDLVYFAQRESGGPVKIGHSDNVRDRLTNIARECKERIRVLLLLPGGQPVEAELHKRFEVTRLRGEWFAVEDRLTEFIAANALHDKLHEVFRGVFPEPLLGPLRESLPDQPRAPAHPPAPSPSSSLSSISSLISQSYLVTAPSQPRAREDFDPADKAARLVLARRDLWPAEFVTDAEIAAVVSRCRAAWRDEPAAKRLGLTLEHALREAINDAQMYGKRYTSATPEQLLARIEQRVEWILGECRSGRRKATVVATESDVADDARDSREATERCLAADRAHAEAEREKTRAFANDPAAKAKRAADLAKLAQSAAPEQFTRKAAPEGGGK